MAWCSRWNFVYFGIEQVVPMEKRLFHSVVQHSNHIPPEKTRKLLAPNDIIYCNSIACPDLDSPLINAHVHNPTHKPS